MKNLRNFFLLFMMQLCFLLNIGAELEQNQGPKVFLVFGGKTGWIGQKMVELLRDQNHIVHCATSRLENREAIERELDLIKPDYIINAAGITGNPNVDWCEDHQQATIRANIIGALNIADIAYLRQIPVTNFGTGCIYQYDENHPIGSGIGFTEEDEPNFIGSFYSKSKAMLDKLLMSYPNVLNLRLRMPISSDFHPRNFITKISKYPKINNISNSMSILDDLLPISIEMTLRNLRGNFNFTNPGVISHNEILILYKKHINPQLTWVNIEISELNTMLKAKRSNNELNVSKLLLEFPDIPHIQISIHSVFEKMKQHSKNEGE